MSPQPWCRQEKPSFLHHDTKPLCLAVGCLSIQVLLVLTYRYSFSLCFTTGNNTFLCSRALYTSFEPCSPVGCIIVEICMSFCRSGCMQVTESLFFFSCFCLISAAFFCLISCGAAAPLHLLNPDVSGKRTLWYYATSVKNACAAGGAGVIPLAELGQDSLPLPPAFVTSLFFSASFFSVKCSEGLLGPIMLIMGLNLDPSWKDFSPSLN